MSERAVVLGGGGPVGVGWEVGLAASLASAGIDLADADLIVGTSAGSITGAKIASGADMVELAESGAALFERSTQGVADAQPPMADLSPLLELTMRPVQDGETPEERLATIGNLALEAQTVPDEIYLGMFQNEFGDVDWPDGFQCTAIDAHTGEFVVWSSEREAPLDLAVASSCCVPGIFPPVSIFDRRYIDGGMRTPLNADLASGYRSVLIVSCMPFEIPGIDDPTITAFFARDRAAIDALRDEGAQVEVIAPDEEFLGISGYGMNLMDFTRVQAASEAGTRLGKLEAERIAAIW